MERPLEFSYDTALDVMTIDGVNYAGAVFRYLGFETPPGRWVRIVKREDGVVHIEQTNRDVTESHRLYLELCEAISPGRSLFADHNWYLNIAKRMRDRESQIHAK